MTPTCWIDMLGYAFVDAFMRGNCTSALGCLKAAIAEVDGVITECATERASAVRMNVELQVGAIARLTQVLEASGVHVFEACALELAKAKAVVPATKPLTAMLHVTLVA